MATIQQSDENQNKRLKQIRLSANWHKKIKFEAYISGSNITEYCDKVIEAFYDLLENPQNANKNWVIRLAGLEVKQHNPGQINEFQTTRHHTE